MEIRKDYFHLHQGDKKEKSLPGKQEESIEKRSIRDKFYKFISTYRTIDKY